MKIKGYIHKGYLEEIEVEDTPDKEEQAFWHPKRGIMVWDKRWGEGENDIEVCIEIPNKE